MPQDPSMHPIYPTTEETANYVLKQDKTRWSFETVAFLT